jgi:hypothetical protein
MEFVGLDGNGLSTRSKLKFERAERGEIVFVTTLNPIVWKFAVFHSWLLVLKMPVQILSSSPIWLSTLLKPL